MNVKDGIILKFILQEYNGRR